MSQDKNQIRTAVLIFMVFAAACFRFVNIAPNFSPITGMALFGAAYFSRKYLALVIPFLAIWGSNMVLDNLIYAQYYDGFQWFSQPYVFGAFGLIVLLGFGMFKKVTFGRVIGASLIASVLFFLVTNFGSWMGGALYPKTLDGLMMSYAAGIPFITNPGAEHYFFLNSVVGNLFFTGLLFGSFELVKMRFPQLSKVKA